jgi:hypothetical protein
MSLKEICLKEKPSHPELCYLVNKSNSAMSSPEELNIITNFVFRNYWWSYFGALILDGIKENTASDEELFLKIKASFMMSREEWI